MFPVFLDEDSMDHALVRGLRSNGLDVLTAAEAGRFGLSDDDQLSFAASQGRAIYTRNLADFTRLHGMLLGEGLHHAGVIVLTDQLTQVGVQLRALVRLARALDEGDMRDRLEFVSNRQE